MDPADVLEEGLQGGTLRIEETAASISSIDEDGNLKLHLIRPCVGKGKGRHLYEADMLQRDAGVFEGWKMYVNHLSPEAKRKLAGLPRPVEHVGGRVLESWWDPSVPADPEKGLGEGAVVGKVRPTPFIRELVENDPEIIGCSIRADATGVRPVNRGGQRVFLVEGISPQPGSVDWVTEAGAGGRVVQLMEAYYANTDDPDAADLTDDEFMEHIADTRPELYEALAARGNDGTRGAEVTDPEALVEALYGTDEGREIFEAAVAAAVEGQIATSFEAYAEQQASLNEQKMEEERELMRAEAEAAAERGHQLRDMRDEAHQLINEAKLPAAYQRKLRAEYDLKDGQPTSKLDVIDDIDEEGAVAKGATEKLHEAVAQSITEAHELVGAANPTRVTGMGGTGADGDTPSKPADRYSDTVLTAHAGFKREDLAKIRAIQEAATDRDWQSVDLETVLEDVAKKENA